MTNKKGKNTSRYRDPSPTAQDDGEEQATAKQKQKQIPCRNDEQARQEQVQMQGFLRLRSGQASPLRPAASGRDDTSLVIRSGQDEAVLV
jgi:hypothetical protein